ncbi:MAG TPA: MFS transporter [Armatimonadota bacterium]|nr:MFS transporter [Armatimonadota bacterium]
MGVNHRRNRRLILGFELIWGTGLPFLQSTTTLPGYLASLGVSGFLIGLVPALFAGGIAIVQPFSLYLIRPGPRRLHHFLWAYRLGIFCYLAMAASAAFLPADAVTARVALFFICYAGYVFVAGAGDPHYIAVIVESVPKGERGWFFGQRQICFGLGGIIGGVFAVHALCALPAPANFGLSIFIGALLLMLATIHFSRFEYVAQGDPGKRPPLLSCLVDVYHLARRQRSFLLFCAVTALFVLAQGPFAFLALYVKDVLHAGDGLYGKLGFLTMASSLVFAFLLGRAGDRAGHRRAFMMGVSLYAVGLVLMLVGASSTLLLGAYFLAAICGPTWAVCGFNLGYECSDEPDPARVYAGVSLVSAPLRIIGPPAAGAAIDQWGHAAIIAGAAGLALMALLILALLPARKAVREHPGDASREPGGASQPARAGRRA